MIEKILKIRDLVEEMHVAKTDEERTKKFSQAMSELADAWSDAAEISSDATKDRLDFSGSLARTKEGWRVVLKSPVSGEESVADVEVLEDAPAKVAQAIWDAAQVYF